MKFIKSQAKGAAVGLGIVIAWAALDWLAAKHGLPFGHDRSYSDTFFGAAAGAGAVYAWLS